MSCWILYIQMGSRNKKNPEVYFWQFEGSTHTFTFLTEQGSQLWQEVKFFFSFTMQALLSVSLSAQLHIKALV